MIILMFSEMRVDEMVSYVLVLDFWEKCHHEDLSHELMVLGGIHVIHQAPPQNFQSVPL